MVVFENLSKEWYWISRGDFDVNVPEALPAEVFRRLSGWKARTVKTYKGDLLTHECESRNYPTRELAMDCLLIALGKSQWAPEDETARAR